MQYQFLISRLEEEHLTPFEDEWPWHQKPLTRQEIEKAISSEEFLSGPVDPKWTRKQHAAHVAYLVKHPDMCKPVDIDVGVSAMCFRPQNTISAGHHDLAAAMIRGDTHVLVDPSGSLDLLDWLSGKELVQDGGTPT